MLSLSVLQQDIGYAAGLGRGRPHEAATELGV